MSDPTLYTVRATRRAERELRRLPQDVIKRIDATFEQLQHNPRPPGVVMLTGQKGPHWRLRVGTYRILYQIDDQHRLLISTGSNIAEMSIARESIEF